MRFFPKYFKLIMNEANVMTMLTWIIGFIFVFIVIERIWHKKYISKKKLLSLERKLLTKSTIKLPHYSGKGIVMVIDDDTIFNGALLLVSLRKVYCKLPILVCHAGNSLNQFNKRYLLSLQAVELLDISEKTGITEEELIGPQLRVYSLIYSPFKEVILINPNLLFFMNPEILFNEFLYKTTGALFWKDRPTGKYDNDIYSFIKKFIPYKIERNPILLKQSNTFQSQDLLIIDKSKHLSGLQKLLIITDNSDFIYNTLKSDKETYWIAFEIAGEQYSFIQSYPGIVGEYSNQMKGCTLYFDSSGRPLCWDASTFVINVNDFTHFSYYEENSNWIGLEKNLLQNAIPRPLSSGDIHTINSYSYIIPNIKARLLESN